MANGRTEGKVHEAVTIEAVMALAHEDDCGGFCISCGEEAAGVEPDAAEYTCEACGAAAVYGCEELLCRSLTTEEAAI